MAKFMIEKEKVFGVNLYYEGDNVFVSVDGADVLCFNAKEEAVNVFENELRKLGLSVTADSEDESPSDGG